MPILRLDDLLRRYAAGERHFREVVIQGGAERVDLAGIDLRGSDLQEVELRDSDLRGANLGYARLSHADLQGADLTEAQCDGAEFQGVNLVLAQCRNTTFRNALLNRSNLTRATFDGSQLDFARLEGARLSKASFVRASLRRAQLRGAVAGGARFTDANLRGADLQTVAATDADFSGADLDGASLRASRLSGAAFTRASTRGLDLTEATDTQGALSAEQLAEAASPFISAADVPQLVGHDEESFVRAYIPYGEHGERNSRSSRGASDEPVSSTQRAGRYGSASGAPSRPPLRAATTPGHGVVRVFYATDREPASSHAPWYAGTRGDGSLSLGVCEVSIPRQHRMGNVETPALCRLQSTWSERKHVILQRVNALRPSAFWRDFDTQLLGGNRSSALLYIHGYNVSFRDAARRCAQLAYDLNFDGVPVFYSWPSKGRLLSYMADEASVEWSGPHLADLISDILQRKQPSELHIISHSMGTRALLYALSHLGGGVAPQTRVANIALTAPDVDAAVFRQATVHLLPSATTTTLYASDRDMALTWARRFHSYRRAGEAGPQIVVMPDLVTIDASDLDTRDLLGHSYFAEQRSVIGDIYDLLLGRGPHERHGLRPADANGLTYWRFQP